MAQKDLDKAQDNFQEEAGDTVEESGNVAEETWDETKRRMGMDEDESTSTDRDS